MTLFEYLAIAFSLVLSFSAMRLVAGLPYAAQPDRRYWVHLVFVSTHLLLTAVVFWNLWSFRDATWTLSRFLLVLTIPGLVYFTACTLIPEQASTIESWRSYYYSVRPRFFMGVLALVLAISLGLAVVLEVPLLHPARVPQVMAMAAALLGAYSSSARVHAGLALFLLLNLVATGYSIFLEPGSVAQ